MSESQLKEKKENLRLEKAAIKAHRDFIQDGKAFVCTLANYGEVGHFFVDMLGEEYLSGLKGLTAEGIQKTAAGELKKMLSG